MYLSEVLVYWDKGCTAAAVSQDAVGTSVEFSNGKEHVTIYFASLDDVVSLANYLLNGVQDLQSPRVDMSSCEICGQEIGGAA